MAIVRQDLRAILANEELDVETKAKKLLDLFHGETDTIRDEKDALQAQVDTLNKSLERMTADKEKAEKTVSELKDAQNAKEARSKKEAAFTALLKESKVGEKHIKLILKATDIDSMELAEDGKSLKNAEGLTKSIQSDYADYIAVEGQKGAAFDQPPARGGAKMTKEQIMAIADTATRQKAIAENSKLFGF